MIRTRRIPTTWSNIPIGTYLDDYEVLATEEDGTGNYRAQLDEDGVRGWTPWTWGARHVTVTV